MRVSRSAQVGGATIVGSDVIAKKLLPGAAEHAQPRACNSTTS